MANRYSIVGTQFTGVPESYLAGLKAGTTPAVLVREPDNPHDANAVAVYVDGVKVGYVPKKQNAVLAQFIDQSGREVDMRPGLAQDEKAKMLPPVRRRGIDAIFVRSPNSGFPMVEV